MISDLLARGFKHDSRSVLPGEVTPLAHEIPDDSVERAPLVAQGGTGAGGACLTGAELPEVFCRLYPDTIESRVTVVDPSIVGLTGHTFGTSVANSSSKIRPTGWPDTVMSRKTKGLD